MRMELDEKAVMKMKASTRKAWSIRSLRWMAQMPQELLVKDISLLSTKKELKKWIKGTVPVKGDRILWGQKLTGEMKRRRKHNQAGSERDNDEDRNETSSGEVHNEERDRNIVDEEEVRQEAEEQLEGNIQHGIVNMKTRTQRVRRNDDEGGQELRMLLRSKELGRSGRNRKMGRLGRSKKPRRSGRSKKLRWPGRSKRTGLGGWVLGNLPRAGAEPQNPGKRGSLSPQVMECYTTGQIILLWLTLSLTLTYFMSMREEQVHARIKCLQLDSEEQGEKKSSMVVQPRCGVG